MKVFLSLFLALTSTLAFPIMGFGQLISTGFLKDTNKVVILFKDSASHITLADQDINTAENILEQAIQKEIGSKTSSKQMARYRIQMVPTINEKGEKQIWVNFFCSTLSDYFPWKKKIFSRDLVMDGGSCYFDLIINLSTGTYSDFGMNGLG